MLIQALSIVLTSDRSPPLAYTRDIPMPAPVPPFTRESAILKVRLAEDAWNSRDPHRVSLAYAEDSRWRNRSEFINGRAEGPIKMEARAA